MSRGLTIVTYLALLLFGMAQGVLGAFLHASGPAPLAAIGFDLGILATCLLGGWGTQRPLGGLMPTAGWFAAVIVLASGTGSGSVLIAASSAGEWFLFGGAASAMAGLIAAFTIWSRPGRSAPRAR